MKNQAKLFSIISIFILGALFTQSCEKVKDAVAFNVDQDLPDHHFSLDSANTSAKGETLLYFNSYMLNMDSIFEANGVDAGIISEGKFKQLVLEIDNPSDEMELGFVSTVSFRIGQTEKPENAKTIATAKGINHGDTKIIFEVNSETMDKYLEQKKFFFFVYGTLVSQVPVEKLPLVIKSKVQFKVSPLK